MKYMHFFEYSNYNYLELNNYVLNNAKCETHNAKSKTLSIFLNNGIDLAQLDRHIKRGFRLTDNIGPDWAEFNNLYHVGRGYDTAIFVSSFPLLPHVFAGFTDDFIDFIQAHFRHPTALSIGTDFIH